MQTAPVIRKIQSKKPQGTPIREALSSLDTALEELKVQYELYFNGISPRAPEKQHNLLRRQIVSTRKLPFKNSEHLFRLRCFEHKYSTYNTYWMRVLREKEAGTYHKDLFKLELKEALEKEEAFKKTDKGKAEGQIENLFKSYTQALTQQFGKKASLDFQTFKQELIKKAKLLKERNPGKKVSFAVGLKDGKVSLNATLK